MPTSTWNLNKKRHWEKFTELHTRYSRIWFGIGTKLSFSFSSDAYETEGGTGNLKTPDDMRAAFQQPSRFPSSESRYKPWRQMVRIFFLCS